MGFDKATEILPKWQEEWHDTYHLYIWHDPISQISGSQIAKLCNNNSVVFVTNLGVHG